ncbi:fungal-specific transcription factor domain-containing protein [Cadophora sp. MPI-SDFR-AT-0126]|nr:fungal-specific transcription factor domain-containing protein [Leotiomycetes sp. MPI-SDFR-AT-0126]
MPLITSLRDPLVQDLETIQMRYVHYFASDVCKELVLYDNAGNNAFRDLIPLASHHPILLNVMIANAALHMANAYQNSAAIALSSRPAIVSPGCDFASPNDSRLTSAQQARSYRDSLAAKQRALGLLRSTLADEAALDIDVILAVVLLLIECELLDSGRDTWKYHVAGTRPLIEKLCQPGLSTTGVGSAVRNTIISNCLIFDILGSTLGSITGSASEKRLSAEQFSLLQDAEGNHCSSMPVTLLHVAHEGARIFQQSYAASSLDLFTIGRYQQQLVLFLDFAQLFDPLEWAIQLQVRSPSSDVEHRKHVASAHRAAVCLYLCRALLFLCPEIVLPCDLESLAAEIITHLTIIKPSDTLFTATTWPAFIAGAETTDPARQAWARRRFAELWDVEPWGLMTGAQEALDLIWLDRGASVSFDKGGTVLDENKLKHNWLVSLRESGVDWLIA